MEGQPEAELDQEVRALRAGNEPEDVFRRYMALYAWEQAWCHLSPQLAVNLERHWKKARSHGEA